MCVYSVFVYLNIDINACDGSGVDRKLSFGFSLVVYANICNTIHKRKFDIFTQHWHWLPSISHAEGITISNTVRVYTVYRFKSSIRAHTHHVCRIPFLSLGFYQAKNHILFKFTIDQWNNRKLNTTNWRQKRNGTQFQNKDNERKMKIMDSGTPKFNSKTMFLHRNTTFTRLKWHKGTDELVLHIRTQSNEYKQKPKTANRIHDDDCIITTARTNEPHDVMMCIIRKLLSRHWLKNRKRHKKEIRTHTCAIVASTSPSSEYLMWMHEITLIHPIPLLCISFCMLLWTSKNDSSNVIHCDFEWLHTTHTQ